MHYERASPQDERCSCVAIRLHPGRQLWHSQYSIDARSDVRERITEVAVTALTDTETLFADVPQVARILGQHPQTVRAAIAAGTIPAIKIGQRWRVPTSWLRQAAGLETTEAGH
jgi:excisionase family DNA binding protein